MRRLVHEMTAAPSRGKYSSATGRKYGGNSFNSNRRPAP